MALTENLSFLRAWLRAPHRVGALAPSGPALARLMTAQINALDGPVIELGPGTGAFTRALLDQAQAGNVPMAPAEIEEHTIPGGPDGTVSVTYRGRRFYAVPRQEAA